jgi:hypothetical protein
MKGQVNVDYAIAVGVFIAGVVTAVTLTVGYLQPTDTGFTESLLTQTSTVSDRFSEETSWSIDEKNVYYDKNNFSQPTLSVIGVKPDRYYSVAEENIIGSDIYTDRIVYSTNQEYVRILGSNNIIESSDSTESFSISASEFSNNLIEVGYSDSGIDYYDYDQTRLIEGITIDTGVESTAEGNLSARVDYGDQKVYFYGGDLPEFYVRSPANTSSISVSESLTEAEVVETGDSYDLTGSNSFSSEGPVIFSNSTNGLGIAGSGTEYTVTSSSSGTTEVDITGSYYAYGFEDSSEGMERAEARLEFPRTAINRLEGVNLSQSNELFNQSNTAFGNSLGITGGFNISYNGSSKGSSPPDDITVVSQTLEKQILMLNGSLRSEDLEMRLWQ